MWDVANGAWHGGLQWRGHTFIFSFSFSSSGKVENPPLPFSPMLNLRTWFSTLEPFPRIKIIHFILHSLLGPPQFYFSLGYLHPPTHPSKNMDQFTTCTSVYNKVDHYSVGNGGIRNGPAQHKSHVNSRWKILQIHHNRTLNPLAIDGFNNQIWVPRPGVQYHGHGRGNEVHYPYLKEFEMWELISFSLFRLLLWLPHHCFFPFQPHGKEEGGKEKGHLSAPYPSFFSTFAQLSCFNFHLSFFFLSFTLPEKFPSMTETYSKSSQRGGQPRKVVRRESLAIKIFQKNIISFHIWMFMHPFSHLLIRIKHKIQVVKGRRWSMWLQFQLTNAGWLNGVAWKQKLTSIFRQCWESKAIWDKIARIGGAKTARMGCLFFSFKIDK